MMVLANTLLCAGYYDMSHIYFNRYYPHFIEGNAKFWGKEGIYSILQLKKE